MLCQQGCFSMDEAYVSPAAQLQAALAVDVGHLM